MGSYSDALRKGLEVKERRNTTETQVKAALADAASDLVEVVGGGLTLHLLKKTKSVAEPQTRGGQMMGFIPRTSEEEYWIIEARKPQMPAVRVAEVEMAEGGYPISLRWPNNYASADDEGGFRNALLALLSSRHAAEKLAPLMIE